MNNSVCCGHYITIIALNYLNCDVIGILAAMAQRIYSLQHLVSKFICTVFKILQNNLEYFLRLPADHREIVWP